MQQGTAEFETHFRGEGVTRAQEELVPNLACRGIPDRRASVHIVRLGSAEAAVSVPDSPLSRCPGHVCAKRGDVGQGGWAIKSGRGIIGEDGPEELVETRYVVAVVLSRTVCRRHGKTRDRKSTRLNSSH